MERRTRTRGFGGMFRSFLPRVVRAEEIPAAPDAATTAPAAQAAEDGMPGAGAPPKKEEPAMQFESFNREWQNMTGQDNFDGFRIEAQNKVTDVLQATHTLFLGTQLRECGYIYQFGPYFQTPDGRTMMVARAGLDGSVNARGVQKVGSSFELKGSSNSHLKDPQRNMHEGALEYTGSQRALALKIAHQGPWIFGGSFTQKIMSSLQAGGDVTMVGVNGLTTIGQMGLRYSQGRDIFNVALSRTPDPRSPGAQVHECRLQYVRKVTDRVSLGSEFKYSYPDRESGLQLAYEYAFRNARVQGLLDSDGKVSCCVQDFTGYGFSGTIDYARGDYKFGIVMHVLPQPEPGQQPM